MSSINVNCDLCELHEEAHTVCMAGDGPEEARVVVIGEAPGAQEDEEGRPFVGRSGVLLNRALEQLAGLSRDDIYVTNVAKCRPPDNRTPGKKEIEACTDAYLWDEIEQVGAEWVIVTGNTPLKALTGKSGITSKQGDIIPVTLPNGYEVKVYPVMHPAAILRNPGWAEGFATAIKNFGKAMNGTREVPETDIKPVLNVKSLQTLRALLMEAPVIAYDIETYVFPDPKFPEGIKKPAQKKLNLQEWHGTRSAITSISFTFEEGTACVVPLCHRDHEWDWMRVLRFLSPVFEREDCTFIAHNGKFDVRWLRAKGVPARVDADTMHLCHHVDENRPKGLKALAKTYLDADSYAEELSNSYEMPLRDLLVYNGRDTDYTFRLYYLLGAQMEHEIAGVGTPNSLYAYRALTQPVSETLAQVEELGIYIDQDRWRERYRKAVSKRERIKRKFEELYAPDGINLNSPKQLGELMYGEMGLPVVKYTDTKQPSTDEESMLKLAASGHNVARGVLAYRKWDKFIGTYLIPWWYHQRDGLRVKTTYKETGTKTARLSGTGGIQQCPRDPFIRGILGAPEGWKLVLADYSQIELRIAAEVAREETMLEIFEDDHLDIHTVTGCEVTGKDEITKTERTGAKAVNFGFIYGMGAKHFVDYMFQEYGITVSIEQAKRFRRTYFDLYPGLLDWHEEEREKLRHLGHIDSFFGVRRHLPDVFSHEDKVRMEAERQAINFRVQSPAAHITIGAVMRLNSKLPKSKARVVGTVHDSILFEVRDDAVEDVCPVIKSTMEDKRWVARDFGWNIGVPIKADIEVGQHWGEGEEWQSAN